MLKMFRNGEYSRVIHINNRNIIIQRKFAFQVYWKQVRVVPFLLPTMSDIWFIRSGSNLKHLNMINCLLKRIFFYLFSQKILSNVL